MSWDSNIYYHPEKFGLTTVGEIDFSSGSYEFDLLVVWMDERGEFYYAEDSGCSCPSPFESFGRDTITPAKPEEIVSRATYLTKNYDGGGERYSVYATPSDVQALRDAMTTAERNLRDGGGNA